MTSRATLATLFAFLFSLPMLAGGTRKNRIDEAGATVLCYHIVESPLDRRMEISRDTFSQQMDYLEMTGYTVIPLRDLYDFVKGTKQSLPKNAVVVTIDDGWRSTYTQVYPEMKRRHFPFTVFIYPKIIGQTAYALTWKQVKEMADAGVDIQSHSYSHPFLTRKRHEALDDRAYADWLDRELVQSKKTLEKETGRTISFLAYPYGDFDRHLTAAVTRAGYSAALTCEFGRVRQGSDPLRMKRMVIDKQMDFASFRRYLGAGQMPIQRVAPLPGQFLDPAQPVIAAKIPNYKTIDPKSVGMTLMSVSNVPYTYDPKDGSITMALHDVLNTMKGKYQRALIWANDTKGKRVEASLTFRLPTADDLKPAVNPLDPAAIPAPVKAIDDPAAVPLPSQIAVPSGGASATAVSRTGVPKG
jgi:peptidoglycan/xylan/chitin deacetylase (PgdA/CDA1 family)